jgi:hypothetical protein
MKWKDYKAKLRDETHEARVAAFLGDSRFANHTVIQKRAIRKQLSLQRYEEINKDFRCGQWATETPEVLPW